MIKITYCVCVFVASLFFKFSSVSLCDSNLVFTADYEYDVRTVM